MSKPIDKIILAEETCIVDGILRARKSEVPASHLEVVKNTKLSYAWKEDLTSRCVFIGTERVPRALQIVWLFEWHDEQGNSDVAVIGTLRVIDKNWSWEFSRMDGDHGDEVIVEVYGEKYENFFIDNTTTLLGYRLVSGSCP